MAQTAPFNASVTVAESAVFNAQINGGELPYTTLVSNSALSVNSTTGAITSTGTLAAGTYTVSGTFIDDGPQDWTFTLAVTDPEPSYLDVTLIPSQVTIVGIALETTPGVLQPGGPTAYLRVHSIDMEDVSKPIEDETVQGDYAGVHQTVPGPISSKTSIKAPVALDTAGFPITGILNGVAASTADDELTTHGVALAVAAPATYSLWYFTNAWTKATAGNVFAKVELSGTDTDKLCDWSADLVGLPTQYVDAITPSWTAELPIPMWASSFNVGYNSGSASNGFNESWTLSLEREAKAVTTASGTRNPTTVFGGKVTATLKSTIIANGTTTVELDSFVAGEQRYISILLTGISSPVESLLIESLTTTYSSGKPERGKDHVQYDFEGTCVATPNTLAGGGGSNSPVQITLVNAIDSGIYGGAA
jgi:hypothetical protein